MEMPNTGKELLYSAIWQSGYSIIGLCRQLHIASKTFYSKLEGKTDWKLGEIMRLQELLHLTDNELITIFFTRKVA